MSLDARYVVKPVRKALQLLEALVGEGRPLTLSELAERTALPKTTAFRYLYTLRSAGFVVQHEGNDAYAAGPRLAAMPAPAAAIEALRQAALPEMQRLQLRFNETVNLGVADGGEVVYVAMVGSTRSLRMEAALGARDPLHSTSLGKAMLAARPAAERLVGLPRRLLKRTPRTITSRTALGLDLASTAERGFALDLEENEPGAHCVAAAIPIAGLAAAISISGPVQRLPVEVLPRIGATLAQAAAAVAARFEAASTR
jgi:DNA-binding IclR family transcriptional regulator